MSQLKNFAVSYSIDYSHRVIVGMKAENEQAAIKIASDAFDAGDIWENTPEMPLLFDDYEETEGETLVFTAEEVAEFPKPDASVIAIQEQAFARLACQAVLAGDFESARDLAVKAVPWVAKQLQTETQSTVIA